MPKIGNARYTFWSVALFISKKIHHQLFNSICQSKSTPGHPSGLAQQNIKSHPHKKKKKSFPCFSSLNPLNPSNLFLIIRAQRQIYTWYGPCYMHVRGNAWVDDYHIFGPLFQMLIMMRNYHLFCPSTFCPSFTIPSPNVTAFSQCVLLDAQNDEESR